MIFNKMERQFRQLKGALSLHWLWMVVTIWMYCCISKCSADVCTELCDCHQAHDEFYVHCIAKGLKSIPTQIPTNVTNLDLSMNSLTHLDEHSFPETLIVLRRLDLHTCKIKSIAFRTFYHFLFLTELVLSNNDLREISLGTFLGLRQLRVLSLNNNDLIYLDSSVFEGLALTNLNLYDNQYLRGLSPGVFNNASVEALSLDRSALSNDIDQNIFQPLAKRLKVLHWSYSKHPLTIPYKIFAGLRLHSLLLTHNMIEDTSFLDYTTAKILDLSHNNLYTFNLGGHIGLRFTESLILQASNLSTLESKGTFRCATLKELDLSENHLSFVSILHLVGMTNLTRLNLRTNSIHYLPESLEGVFRSLSFLDISDNDLSCNCSMTWFMKWHDDPGQTEVQGGGCHNVADSHLCLRPLVLSITHDSRRSGVILDCEAQGHPLPDIEWKLNFSNNMATLSNNTHQTSSTYSNVTLRRTSRLWLPFKASTNSCLSFICIAKNSAGTDQEKYTLCGAQSHVKLSERKIPKSVQPTSSDSVSYVPALIGVLVAITITTATIVASSKWLRRRWVRRRSTLRIAEQNLICSERGLIEDQDSEKGHISVESV